MVQHRKANYKGDILCWEYGRSHIIIAVTSANWYSLEHTSMLSVAKSSLYVVFIDQLGDVAEYIHALHSAKKIKNYIMLR